MFFADIVGFDQTKKSLVQAVNSNHVAHAQLFLGNEGSANLALAIAYSRYINCEDKQPSDACGQCVSCIQFNKLTHPDLQFVFPMTSLEKIGKEELKAHLVKQFRAFVQQHTYGNLHDWGVFVGAENKQFNISVEEGRGILQNVSMKPYLSPYKIVLIWLPELMNSATANAILKVLEEPPAQTLFLLVSNNYEKLLATILSRCQLVKVRAFTNEEIADYLINRQLSEAKRANSIAKIADGNLQKAIFLTQEKESDNYELFATWMRLCFARKFADLLSFSEDLAKKGRENQKGFLLYGLEIARESLMSRTGNDDLVKQDEVELQFVSKFALKISEQNIEKMAELLNEAFVHIERNGNAKIVFFDTSIKLSFLFTK